MPLSLSLKDVTIRQWLGHLMRSYNLIYKGCGLDLMREVPNLSLWDLGL